jgi:hypothetical protein
MLHQRNENGEEDALGAFEPNVVVCQFARPV